MFSKKTRELRHSLALRLTLWYAGIFTLSSCLAFLLLYLLVSSVVRQQTDEDLLKRAEQFATLMDLYGVEAVNRMAVTETQAAGVKKIFFRFLYPSGTVFSSSNMSYWQNVPVNHAAIRQLLEGRTRVFETVASPERDKRIRILYAFIGSGYILQLGQSAEKYTGFLTAYRQLFWAATTLLLLTAAGVGWIMAKQALAGVETITQTAREITGGNLDKRVPVTDRGDEIDQLAVTFNLMVDRIQRLVAEIKEMNDNIAHDLKSPLTRIRGLTEVTLTTASSAADYESMAASTIEECDRLLDMINTMLVISKAEAGVAMPASADMDLASVVQEACELFRPAAEDKNVALTCNAEPSVTISGDIRLVQRMVANLLDNAVKYTSPGGKVHAGLRRAADGRVELTVSDTGIGIAAEDLPHIFERFYRCDRSRSQFGTGLGLSLARAVARVHGGDIRVVSRTGEGSTFSVYLSN